MDKAKLLQTAMDRIDKGYDADLIHRERMLSDLEFAVGEGGHWDEETRRQREAAGKPCLTFNRAPQFIRKVTAQIRDMNPAIKVSPGDQEASEDTANVIEGLIRQIEAESRAADIYERATEQAAAGSIGYWRVLTKYADGDTFDQDICIAPIYDPFTVILDPEAREVSRSDARWGFIVTDMTEEEFKAEYPKAQMVDATDAHRPSGKFSWRSGNTVAVAEYYWIEDKTHTIGLLANGQTVRDPTAGHHVIKTRKVVEPRVKWAKISGNEVLEGPLDVPGRYIPIVAVVGEEWHIGGSSYRSSVFRYAKDAQVLYNFSRSVGAEVMGQQSMAPWLLTGDMIAGFEQYWQNPHKAYAYLLYNPDQIAGKPERISPPVPSSAVLSEIQLAAEDMKATTGIYDASLGARSNETSGIAIAQRQQESEASTSSYADNMVKSITHTGDLIISMIPEVYDAERMVRILGPNDEEELVAINQLMTDMQGEITLNNLKTGRYAVRVSVGPSYQSQREASAAGMLEFMRAMPEAASVAGDLIIAAQDWPEAERIAARVKKLLPEGIDDEDGQSGQDPQAQMMQMQMMQEQMAQQMQIMQMQMQQMQAKTMQEQARAEKATSDAERAALEVQEKALELSLRDPGVLPGVPVGTVTPYGV